MNSEIGPDREVFNQMAAGWYNFRHYSIFPKELDSLARRWRQGRLLNVGSGHGADFLPFRDKFELYGLDFSTEMIRQARRYSFKFKFPVSLSVGDARELPFAAASFDWAIAVATYHHIKGRKQQLHALEELRRVLKPGGEAFITVWNRCQRAFWFKGSEVAVPWRAEGRLIFRYYHMFTYREVAGLAKEAGFTLLKSFAESSYHLPIKYFSRNICLLVKN